MRSRSHAGEMEDFKMNRPNLRSKDPLKRKPALRLYSRGLKFQQRNTIFSEGWANWTSKTEEALVRRGARMPAHCAWNALKSDASPTRAPRVSRRFDFGHRERWFCCFCCCCCSRADVRYESNLFANIIFRKRRAPLNNIKPQETLSITKCQILFLSFTMRVSECVFHYMQK